MTAENLKTYSLYRAPDIARMSNSSNVHTWSRICMEFAHIGGRRCKPHVNTWLYKFEIMAIISKYGAKDHRCDIESNKFFQYILRENWIRENWIRVK